MAVAQKTDMDCSAVILTYGSVWITYVLILLASAKKLPT